MSEALLAPVPHALHSLYFMIKPEHGAALAAHAVMKDARARHGLRGGVVDSERQHVTLHALGDYAERPVDLVERARRAGAAVDVEPFEVAFDRLVGWGPEARLLALRGDSRAMRGLRVLQRAVAAAMVDEGLGHLARSSFRPHVSLLYGDQALPAEAIEPIHWCVDELLLIESVFGAGEHRMLGRWPLVRRQGRLPW